MWPWAHAAFGYLLYRLWVEARDRSLRGDAVLALGLGTQLPDLIDKPLAWTVAVLPTGRTLGHSMLFLILGVGVGWILLDGDRHRRLLAVGAFGVLAHQLGDALPSILWGNWREAGFLLWPLVPPIEYATEPSFIAHFRRIEPTPFFVGQLLLTVVALALWYRDGLPGLGVLRRRLSG